MRRKLSPRSVTVRSGRVVAGDLLTRFVHCDQRIPRPGQHSMDSRQRRVLGVTRLEPGDRRLRNSRPCCQIALAQPVASTNRAHQLRQAERLVVDRSTCHASTLPRTQRVTRPSRKSVENGTNCVQRPCPGALPGNREMCSSWLRICPVRPGRCGAGRHMVFAARDHVLARRGCGGQPFERNDRRKNPTLAGRSANRRMK